VQQAVDKEVKQLRSQGLVVDQRQIEEAKDRQIKLSSLLAGASVLIGVIFVACAVLIQTYPVPATVLSLVLYIGANLVFAAIAPESLGFGFGLIIKILIVVALVKAVQAAIAYQKEQKVIEATGAAEPELS
jgi:hypothetical protein